MIHYCTCFDEGYLTRGVALLASLHRHSPIFTLWVLCFDDATFAALTALADPALRPIQLEDFERGNPALVETKSTRNKVEYYFTCTPSVPLYVLAQDPAIDAVTYLDADLLFYSDPSSLLATGPGHSVTIIPHGFPEHLRHLEVHGIYNVGLVSFQNDEHGRACLERWRRQCIDWCYDRAEDGRYADQGYLDDWPATFEGVTVVTNPGAGLGPWNIGRYHVDFAAEPPRIDDQPLIFYHFQGFKSIGHGFYDLGAGPYGMILRPARGRLYDPYIDQLRKAELMLSALGQTTKMGAGSARVPLSVRSILRTLWRGQLAFRR